MMKCPYCQSSEKQVKSGKNVSGTQRMKCQVCGRRYTPQAKEHGYPSSLREQAVKMYVDGLNYRRIGRLLGIDHKTVMLWVKAHADNLPNKAPVPQQVVVAEADELFTYVGKKKNEVYIMTIVDRRISCILSWHVDGERTQHAFTPAICSLPIVHYP